MRLWPSALEAVLLLLRKGGAFALASVPLSHLPLLPAPPRLFLSQAKKEWKPKGQAQLDTPTPPLHYPPTLPCIPGHWKETSIPPPNQEGPLPAAQISPPPQQSVKLTVRAARGQSPIP